jgi:hypothetical protein
MMLKYFLFVIYLNQSGVMMKLMTTQALFTVAGGARNAVEAYEARTWTMSAVGGYIGGTLAAAYGTAHGGFVMTGFMAGSTVGATAGYVLGAILYGTQNTCDSYLKPATDMTTGSIVAAV